MEATDWTLSPEDWDSIARQKPACPSSSVGVQSDWVTTALPLNAGYIPLPQSARALPSASGAEFREWRLADSSRVEAWITDAPADGMAANASSHIEKEFECSVAVREHTALVYTFWALDRSRPDTAYGASANVILERGKSINIYVVARARALRDSLLAAVAQLRSDSIGR